MEDRYVVGRDFNTKDWFVYDNATNTVPCHFDTEKDAQRWVDERVSPLVKRLDKVFKETSPWEYLDNEEFVGSGCTDMLATAVKTRPEEVIAWLLDIIEAKE